MFFRLVPPFLLLASALLAQTPSGTTLSNPATPFTRASKPYAVLRRGPVEAVIATNEAVNDEVLPNHRAGYSGVAKLTYKKQKENLFVPLHSGLNFEHILDGTAQTERRLQFEPRNAPMELRLIHKYAVELCQQPTFHHALESCQRYELLPDGVLQLTVEVAPRKPTFRNGYIGLFWASYIRQPESLDIHFRGPEGWVRGVTPAHGELSTHLAIDDQRVFPHDDPFPLTLVHSLSRHRYAEPWYFGVSHGMAFAQMFRKRDEVRITQSPSGGGKGNPAWDFQFYVPKYEVNQVYQFVMRAAYLPFTDATQMERATRKHREALNPRGGK